MIQAPKTFIQRLKYVGPSVIVVGSVVGSGELVLTSLLGAAAGFAFLWWVIFSTISKSIVQAEIARYVICLLYTSPSPRDLSTSRMPSSA